MKLPLKDFYINSDFLFNRSILLSATGISDSSFVYFASRSTNNYQRNNNQNQQIDSSEVISGEEEIESTSSESINEEITIEENTTNEFIQEESEEESQEDLSSSRKTQKAKNTIKKFLSNPTTVYIIGIAVFILFLVGLFLVLFPDEKKPTVDTLLCGGPSLIDGIIIVTKDDKGNLIDKWDFYTYIVSLLNRDLGTSSNLEDKIPYQTYGIALATKLLYDHYDEEKMAEYRQTYNNVCFNSENDTTSFECGEPLDSDTNIFIVDHQVTKENCNSITGCVHYKNPYLGDFGIEEGSCIDSYSGLGTFGDNTKSVYCKVNKSLSEDEITAFKGKGYKFINDEKGLRVNIIVKGTVSNGLKEEEIGFLVAVADSIRGVIMVNDNGTPANTETISEESSDKSACGSNVYANSAPQSNVMCGVRDSGLDVFSQYIERGWPVHKILTFWYDYYLASWSTLGKDSCNLYEKMYEGGLKKLNFLRRSPYNFVDDDNATVLSIMGSLKDTSQEDALYDFNSYIYQNVVRYGIGSGKGIAAAAIALANYFELEKIRMTYSFGGTYYYYGINPNWGTPVKDTAPSVEHIPEDIMIPLGFDCVGFTRWAQINGGLKSVTTHAGLAANRNTYRLYEDFDNHSNVATHGDIIYRKSNGKTVHSKLVIGMLYDYTGVLRGNLIMEAVGRNYGVKIGRVSIRHGYPLGQVPVYGGGSETEDPELLGYTYPEGYTNFKVPYGVIDHSNCFDESGKYKDECVKANASEFFDGALRKVEK